MNLLFLTKFYPFGTGEAFIENEIEVLAKSFNKITIIACEVSEKDKNNIRKLPSNVEAFSIKLGSTKKDLITGFLRKAGYDKNFKDEKKNCKGIVSKLYLDYFESKSQRIFSEIVKSEILKKALESPYMIYSYWFYTTARVAILISETNKPVKMFSRAHGYDLYKERNRANYLPYRKLFLKTFDHIFPCSENGTEYLNSLYSDHCSNVHTSYLGTVDHGLGKKSSDGIFRIVSCSRVVPLKRIDRIIRSLSILEDTNFQIEWVHFGGGDDLKIIEKTAAEKLKKIKFRFTGDVKNYDVLSHYSDFPVDLFINVSTTEGLPVSIMEAISFGIPVIATDVGGTKEIVHDGYTGKLLRKDFEDNELAAEIVNFMQLSADVNDTYRNNCRKYWENNFKAQNNYHLLCEEVLA